MALLVSGASSGLGRYLRDFFAADAYDRAANRAPQNRYDTIIHCAFDVRRSVPAEEELPYIHNTQGLTERLLAIPHRQFVFISSCDVYPPSDNPLSEDITIDAARLPDRYGKSKLAAEALVLAQGKSPLILRPTAMLGPYIRPNSLTKILSGENPKLTLSAASSFNYILHEDIAAFIRLGQTGIFNLASADNVSLGEICRAFGRTAQFGDYHYETGNISNRKAARILPVFSCSSLEVIRRFAAVHSH